ncbi:MAG: hypothetical protein R3D67_16935 [Hyphomicrobiaceae bacterium]
MIIAIGVMVTTTVAVAAFYMAPKMVEPKNAPQVQPDQPRGFGRSMAWLAIRTRDTQRLVEILGLTNPVAANWDNGLGTVYDEYLAESHVFVSPPVNGWTFVVGLALPQPLGRAFSDKTTGLLLGLGSVFIEVQYFLAYPALDYFAWARVVDGKLVRAYATTEDGIVWNKGRQTKDEKQLGTTLYEARGVRKRPGDGASELVLVPTEAHVVALAGKWSINPPASTP